MLVARERGFLGVCEARRNAQYVPGKLLKSGFGLKIWAAGKDSFVCLPTSCWVYKGLYSDPTG